jgi:hypothetical protein
MQQQSPFYLMKNLQAQLQGKLASVDVLALPSEQRQVLGGLKRLLAEVRLDIRDYELSETRTEQLASAREGQTRLGELEKAILAASASGVFSAADVADYSARLAYIASHLR